MQFQYELFPNIKKNSNDSNKNNNIKNNNEDIMKMIISIVANDYDRKITRKEK